MRSEDGTTASLVLVGATIVQGVTVTEVTDGLPMCACGTGTPVLSLAWTGLVALLRRRRPAPPRPR